MEEKSKKTAPRRIADLSAVHRSTPTSSNRFKAPKKIKAWDGGKIVTNKAEALRKFLARKARKGQSMTPEQRQIIKLAVRKNKADTVFVKDMKSMRPDNPTLKNVMKGSSKRENGTKERGNKRKRRDRGSGRANQKTSKRKKGIKNKTRFNQRTKKQKKPRRADGLSLLNSALSSRR